MEAIYIPQLLKAPDKSQSIPIEEFVPGLNTLTPVRGAMKVAHRGTYLEVSVRAEAIVTLTCDRCLQQYNQRLSLDTSELIWLEEAVEPAKPSPSEREIGWEDLSEKLSPEGYFSPDTWLYEQLSLALPLRQLCSPDCQPPAPPCSGTPSPTDSRWASLEALKQQLS